VLSDKRMLEHVPFEFSGAKKLRQKTDQPENSDRLMVLFNQNTGVLSKSMSLLSSRGYELREGVREAKPVEIFKVHEYQYLMKVI
jgi:hypothetical protein